ncbi:MAG TPA: GNAT family N-acetyltransferase [Gaiellaceae bacterium]|nr:GNAT family N-acetyltransferase [Gaiellaceae bacterium]
MEIRPARDDDAEAATAILREVDDARVLSAAAWLHERHTASEREHRFQVVAVDDDAVVGLGAAALDTWTTALDKGWCNVAVTGSQRGRGIGSALLDAVFQHLKELGATRATSFARFSEEGERWAVARGWSRVLSGPLIAVDPRTVPEPSVPSGIRIGSMRDAQLEAVYDAVVEAARDEPRPEPIDNIPYDEFVTEWDQPDVDLDASTIAYDGERVVAFTELRVVGDRGQHGFTGTRRDYRGRGLATVVKRVALRAAAARGVTHVTTSNAEENAAMRAVNRNLGFTPIGEHVIYARDLG